MLTYENVMNAPLDKLRTAVTDWTAMAGKLDEMAEDARNGMKAKADKAEWSGVTAGVARGFVDKTAKEFEDAAKAAKGMHLVLADAHATFKAAQDELKQLAAEAPAAGFRIDATGRVSAVPLPTEAERNAARHDPDYQQTLNANRNAWQARVNRAVENAQDADDSLVRVLGANATDEHDFSGPKFTTLDAEQAARAADLMKKVTGPGGTARNVEALRELEELLDDNREDPEFSTGLFRTIGAEGTLQMYSAMSLDATSLGAAGKDRALMVANIQSDMGAMLGLATHKDVPGHLDAAWTAQLMRAGRKEMDVFGGVRQIYGYQALGALLREGKYDTEFLTSVGRDMVAMDRKDPDAWEFHTPIGLETVLNQGPEGGRGFYPLTGLMEALGNNPDAATAFFNEPVREDSNKDGIVTKDDKAVGGQHGKDRGMVDYMLDKKPYMDGFDITPRGDLRPAHQALGDALMAAVSHRGPGDEDAPPVAHTREMAAVMERIVEKIGDKPELVDAKPGDPDGPLNGLSGHFGQMAAEYMPDIQAAADNNSRTIKANGVMAEFDKAGMARFIGAVGQDPDAYGAMTTAQRTFTTVLVNDVFAHRGSTPMSMRRSGSPCIRAERSPACWPRPAPREHSVRTPTKWRSTSRASRKTPSGSTGASVRQAGSTSNSCPSPGTSWGRCRRTSRRAWSRGRRRTSRRRSRAAISKPGPTSRGHRRPLRPLPPTRCASRRGGRACPSGRSIPMRVRRPPRRRTPTRWAGASWRP